MSQTLFLIISALGILAALGTVLSRNLVHAGLHLVAFFFIVACQFVLLEAEFLAAIQVLIYIGAVAILLMFAIMLTRNVQGDDTTSPSPFWTVPAVTAGMALFVVLCFGINDRIGPEGSAPWKATQKRPSIAVAQDQAIPARAVAVNNMAKVVGDEMMTRYVVAFEVAGLLLTAAMVGAIAIAARHGDDEPFLIRVRSRLTAAAMTGLSPAAGNGQGSRLGPRNEPLTPPAR